MNPYSEEKIQLAVTEDDTTLLDLLGIRHEQYSDDDSSYCRIIVKEDAIDLLNNLTNEEAFDVLDELAQSIFSKYKIGDSFINKRIEDVLNSLSEQYATTIESRIREMVPMITEELEKECVQTDNDITKLLNIPLEILHVIE